MRNKIRLLFVSLLVVMILGSCKKELLKADDSQPMYILPQGDHAFDQYIVDFHQKYGTYILYQFNDADFRWDFTRNIPFVGTAGDPERVAASLTFLKDEFFGFYAEDLFKKMVPYKIMLCKKITPLEPSSEVPLAGLADAVWSQSHIAFGHVDKRWDGFSEQQKKQAKGAIHGAFWAAAAGGNKIQIAPDFIEGIPYSYLHENNYKMYGVFAVPTNQYKDLYEYISRITSHTKAELEEKFFNPQFDPTGVYQRKYNDLISFYKINYKIDLQAIGDAKLHELLKKNN